MKENIEKEEWTEIITPQTAWFDLRLNELWQYRDLIMLFVKRDFITVYKQTLLGPLWHIIQPLMTTFVFVLIFAGIAQIPTDGQPPILFYLCGTTLWGYFSKCLTNTSSTFINNANIFGKVYFPRLTVPISTVISSLFSFLIQFGLFLLIYAYYGLFVQSFQINLWVLAIPYFLLLMAILGLSMGIIISSLTTKYRDLTQLVGFGVQLLMYATPVIYPASILPEKWQWLMNFNPMSPLIEGFRYAFFGTGTFDVYSILYSTIISLVFFLIGLILFHRVERTFMDTV